MTIILDGTTGITTPGLTNTGTSTFEAGTAAAPSIAPTGDPNTGIFFPAADTIAFSEGGVEALRITSTGNLSFSATGQRITGDFSNATVANRLMFQTSTANSGSTVQVIPSGTGTTGAWEANNASDPTNSGGIRILSTTSDSRVDANIRGTGTYLPMTFYAGGSERFRIGIAGQLGVGGANYGTATQVLTSNGPSAAPSWQNAASGAQDYIVQSYGIV